MYISTQLVAVPGTRVMVHYTHTHTHIYVPQAREWALDRGHTHIYTYTNNTISQDITNTFQVKTTCLVHI